MVVWKSHCPAKAGGRHLTGGGAMRDPRDAAQLRFVDDCESLLHRAKAHPSLSGRAGDLRHDLQRLEDEWRSAWALNEAMKSAHELSWRLADIEAEEAAMAAEGAAEVAS